jgi:hypothetical protein
MTGQDDYPYIRAWGRVIGWPESRIRDQVELAQSEDAPAEAVYRNEDGTWTTTDDITAPHTRWQLGLEPLPTGPPDLAIIGEEVQNSLFWSARLRDRFGLTDIQRARAHLLRIRFSTGYRVEVELRLQPPGEPG